MNRQFRTLLVEDDPSDALLALTMVNEVNPAGEAFGCSSDTEPSRDRSFRE
jgi:hypothetical protein